MDLFLLFLIFSLLFIFGLYILQNLNNRLILNFKIIFLINTIIFIFSSFIFYNLDLINFIILFINLVIFKFIVLIILQASVSSIQIQTLKYLNKFGKIKKFNDQQIFDNRFGSLIKNDIFKIIGKKYIKINKKSILFVYYFFLFLKKIYNEKM